MQAVIMLAAIPTDEKNDYYYYDILVDMLIIYGAQKYCILKVWWW